MRSQLLEHLNERVLFFDGAMGTQIQDAGLTAADFALDSGMLSKVSSPPTVSLDGCNELLNHSKPDFVRQIHERYLDAGSDIVETNTFGCTSIVLAEYGLQELVYELAFAGARAARLAADSRTTSTRPKYVVGALGPGTKLLTLDQTTWQSVVDTYQLAFVALIEGGVDALLLETMQDLGLLKAGIIAANRAMAETERSLPIMVQVTMEQTGTMLLGTEIGAALNTIEAFPSVAVIGLNCATGPAEMAPHVRFLGSNSTRPISVQPNAGLPVMEGGQAVYKLSPMDLANHHAEFIDSYGAALVGGCCGTTPEYIKAVVERVGDRRSASTSHWAQVKRLFPGFDFNVKSATQAEAIKLKGCSSLYQFQPYRQDNSILYVGEKTNANGSKAFRDMLAAENWDGLTELAREVESEGSHMIDVCTAFVGRDEVRDMTILLKRFATAVTVPIVIDSTETPVIEAALKAAVGKPLVNSINFEDGGARAHAVLELCQRFGAGVVALTIDEEGMAKTLDKKIEVAERLLELTTSYGLPDHDVFLDMLTFTLGSGDEEFRQSAVMTIEAIRTIKEKHPNVNTILGVSNVSFGLKPSIRRILNSAFLTHAQSAGLTSAIVHVGKIVPESRVEPDIWAIATDLVFDKRRFVESA